MWAYRNRSGNRSVASVSSRKVPYVRSSSAEHCVLLAPRAMPAAYARRSPGSSAAAAIATARPCSSQRALAHRSSPRRYRTRPRKPRSDPRRGHVRPRRRTARASCAPRPERDRPTAREQPRCHLPQPRPPLAGPTSSPSATTPPIVRGASDLPPGEHAARPPGRAARDRGPAADQPRRRRQRPAHPPQRRHRCARRSPTSCSQRSTRPPPAACTAATSRSTPPVTNAGADTAEEWLPLRLRRGGARPARTLSPTADPPSLIDHAQEAGRYTAIAIGLAGPRRGQSPGGDLRLPRAPPHRVRVRRRGRQDNRLIRRATPLGRTG